MVAQRPEKRVLTVRVRIRLSCRLKHIAQVIISLNNSFYETNQKYEEPGPQYAKPQFREKFPKPPRPVRNLEFTPTPCVECPAFVRRGLWIPPCHRVQIRMVKVRGFSS